MRDLELMAACEELELKRVTSWFSEVLLRPEECCDVAALVRLPPFRPQEDLRERQA